MYVILCNKHDDKCLANVATVSDETRRSVGIRVPDDCTETVSYSLCAVCKVKIIGQKIGYANAAGLNSTEGSLFSMVADFQH